MDSVVVGAEPSELGLAQMRCRQLVARVAAKDGEFAKERAVWKAKERELKTRVRNLEREVRELKRGFTR